MRKFQSRVKPTRIKKYKVWWKRDGEFDVRSIDTINSRMLISGVFYHHAIVINLPEKNVFDTPMLLRYINAGMFLEV